jgi:hypothetical protein
MATLALSEVCAPNYRREKGVKKKKQRIKQHERSNWAFFPVNLNNGVKEGSDSWQNLTEAPQGPLSL